MQGLVDVILEGGGGIGQSERQDQVLEMPISGPERRFPLVALLSPNAVVSIFDVQEEF